MRVRRPTPPTLVFPNSLIFRDPYRSDTPTHQRNINAGAEAALLRRKTRRGLTDPTTRRGLSAARRG